MNWVRSQKGQIKSDKTHDPSIAKKGKKCEKVLFFVACPFWRKWFFFILFWDCPLFCRLSFYLFIFFCRLAIILSLVPFEIVIVACCLSESWPTFVICLFLLLDFPIFLCFLNPPLPNKNQIWWLREIVFLIYFKILNFGKSRSKVTPSFSTLKFASSPFCPWYGRDEVGQRFSFASRTVSYNMKFILYETLLYSLLAPDFMESPILGELGLGWKGSGCIVFGKGI